MLGRTLDQVTSALRGEPGTEVRLAVHRDNGNFDFAIHRAAIDVDSVRTRFARTRLRLRPHLAVPDRDREANSSKRSKALQIEYGPLNGLVLDLRNNPGGVLQASVEVADAFLTDADGLIVYTQGVNVRTDLRYLATGRRSAERRAGRRVDQQGFRIRLGDRRRRAAGSPPRAGTGIDELR